MKKEEIRNCLNTLYDAQSLRIATSNRLLQIFSKKLDTDSDDKQEISLDKDILNEYEKINAYKEEKSKSINKCISELKLKFISSEEEYGQVKAYVFLLESEKTYTKLLQKTIENHDVYINFLANVKGCGPIMSANIIAYLEPYKARHASAFHKYAGLDVVVSKDKNGEPITDEEGNFQTHGRSRSDTEDYEYINKNGETAIKKGLTYNPQIKIDWCISFMYNKSKGSKVFKNIL